MANTLPKQDAQSTESAQASSDVPRSKDKPTRSTVLPPETGGPDGPEPTRYGDWERNGRCTDF